MFAAHKATGPPHREADRSRSIRLVLSFFLACAKFYIGLSMLSMLPTPHHWICCSDTCYHDMGRVSPARRGASWGLVC